MASVAASYAFFNASILGFAIDVTAGSIGGN
jgi:hypothetical protein